MCRDGSFINPRRACARVTVVVLCVCVSVCLLPLQRSFTFLLGFSRILIRGFSKKPSVQKL